LCPAVVVGPNRTEEAEQQVATLGAALSLSKESEALASQQAQEAEGMRVELEGQFAEVAMRSHAVSLVFPSPVHLDDSIARASLPI
jgi:hypothetical protein